MSFNVPTRHLRKVKHPALKKQAAWAIQRDKDSKDLETDELQYLEIDLLENPALLELQKIADADGDKKTSKAIDVIIEGRKGVFNCPVPNFKAALGVVRAFFRHDVIDGWAYILKDDGNYYPELIVDVEYQDNDRYNTEAVVIKTTCKGVEKDGGETAIAITTNKYRISPSDITRRKVGDALLKLGILHESKELKQKHCESVARHEDVTRNGFSQQFRFNGKRFIPEDYGSRDTVFTERKVIHDLTAKEEGPVAASVESEYAPNKVGFVPEHLAIRVFDLESHNTYWVAASALRPYVYDKSLERKIILPDSHRNLLEILTTNLHDFCDDIVEGKAAGNVILCKGETGLGKTLTAEVYAELIGKPLYKVRAGELGTTATEITENLSVILDQVRRWGCAALLDEADVFVAKRNDDIQRNAVVAEFLRVLEYFDGLLFMTTNRPNDIDEAIISRCIAIIGYENPPRDDIIKVWGVMAEQFKADLPEKMIEDLADVFPTITPRDIKMLLRLALKTSRKRKEKLSIKIFKGCALFRAIKIKA